MLACWLYYRDHLIVEKHTFLHSWITASELCEPVTKTSRSITGRPVGMFTVWYRGSDPSLHSIIGPSPDLSGTSEVSARNSEDFAISFCVTTTEAAAAAGLQDRLVRDKRFTLFNACSDHTSSCKNRNHCQCNLEVITFPNYYDSARHFVRLSYEFFYFTSAKHWVSEQCIRQKARVTHLRTSCPTFIGS